MTNDMIEHYATQAAKFAQRAIHRGDYDLHTIFMREYMSLWQSLADKYLAQLTR